jgi:hypothetical protein
VQTTTPTALSITGNSSQVVVYWPKAAGGTLQTNADLATANWVDCGGTMIIQGGTNLVTVAPPTGKLSFRLRQ